MGKTVSLAVLRKKELGEEICHSCDIFISLSTSRAKRTQSFFFVVAVAVDAAAAPLRQFIVHNADLAARIFGCCCGLKRKILQTAV
jgi:hypothetical protein